MKKFSLILGLVASCSLYAGNGSTGGGIIFGDQLNPWFLTNTKEVHYCVEIDPQFSSLGREVILEQIQESIQYWKSTFKSSSTYHTFGLDLTVGTQDFILTDSCDSESDIRFQFGFLTEVQKKQIPNHKQLIGLASRTSYDPIILRAKGFIYVAPENGPLRPASTELHAKPWSHGNASSLKLTLMHELGHVFGLQDDFYSDMGLMSARFVEEITAADFVSNVSSNDVHISPPLGCNATFDGYQSVFYDNVEFPGWNSNKNFGSILTELGLPSKFQAVISTKNLHMEILVDNKKFGEISMKSYGEVSGGNSDPAITVYLTNAQKVFESAQESVMNRSITSYVTSRSVMRKHEELKLVDGRSYKVFINYDQYCSPTIGMIYKNDVINDVFSGY